MSFLMTALYGSNIGKNKKSRKKTYGIFFKVRDNLDWRVAGFRLRQ